MKVIGRLYALLLEAHLTRGRSLGLAALGVVAIVLAAVTRSADDSVRASTQLIADYGLGVVVPVATAWVGTSMFGDLIDDRLLVYLWDKPTPRWYLAVAAVAATLTVMVPLVVIPLVIAGIVSGVTELVFSTLVASLLAASAYAGLFVALGLRFRRALWWSLAYILVWENTVARISDGTARFAIRSYTSSILARATDVDIRLGDRSIIAAVVVPLAVAVLATIYTAVRLDHMEVD